MRRRPQREQRPDQRIEYPSRGATYARPEFGVYEYGVYPRSSVLAGQTRRVFLDSFKTQAEAQAAYPGAELCVGSGYTAPSLNHLPGDDDPDPFGDNAAEAADLAHEGDD